jgi:hypothetical protein
MNLRASELAIEPRHSLGTAIAILGISKPAADLDHIA